MHGQLARKTPKQKHNDNNFFTVYFLAQYCVTDRNVFKKGDHLKKPVDIYVMNLEWNKQDIDVPKVMI